MGAPQGAESPLERQPGRGRPRNQSRRSRSISATASSIEMRRCSIVSRSRRVIVLSWRVCPSMVMSAHGRVILAFCSADVRERHLERIRQYGRREDLQWIESGKLED